MGIFSRHSAPASGHCWNRAHDCGRNGPKSAGSVAAVYDRRPNSGGSLPGHDTVRLYAFKANNIGVASALMPRDAFGVNEWLDAAIGC